MRTRWSPPIRAFAHIVLLVTIVYGAGYAATTSKWTFQLYRVWRFPQAHGHHLAATLAEGQLSSDDLCFLVGPSTVREAFDSTIMNESVSDLTFLNGGTSGGSILQYEVMAELIEQSGVRPQCVVVGLNSWMLISRKLQLNAFGYTDFLDLTNGPSLVCYEHEDLRVGAEKKIRANTIWPYHRTSRHIGKLLRSAIYASQTKLSWNEPRELSAYSLWHRELGRTQNFRYDDREPLDRAKCDRLLQLFEKEGMFEPTSYGHAEHLNALRSTLDRLMALAEHVIVVKMPENSFGREVLEPFASDALDAVLTEYEGEGVAVLDMTSVLPDSAFRDVGHLLSSARPDFSRLAAKRIVEQLGIDAPGPLGQVTNLGTGVPDDM